MIPPIPCNSNVVGILLAQSQTGPNCAVVSNTINKQLERIRRNFIAMGVGGWRAVGGVDGKDAANGLGAVRQGSGGIKVGSLDKREDRGGGGRVGRVKEAGIISGGAEEEG